MPCPNCAAAQGAAEVDPKKPGKPVAGKADVLRHVRKRFATFLGSEGGGTEIRLAVEGEEEESRWGVLPDAEIKVHGWWGRLEQLQAGERVWVWFAVDRDRKPRSVLMVADEMSEQDIHGAPYTVGAVDGEGRLEVSIPEAGKKVAARRLGLPEESDGKTPAAGSQVFIQSGDGSLRRAVSPGDFEELRRQQRDWLRGRWRQEGIPGTVSFLHPLGGEMELVLDHEGIRWGRHLRGGSRVTLVSGRPIRAVVKSVEPWRERTRLRLVTNSGLDQLDLEIGQRINTKVPEPPEAVQASDLPTDIGRRVGEEERVDWFLATLYCSCGIAGDRCTGMFYTQASCNVNACGMPNQIAGVIRGMIGEGMDDNEIFGALKKERGRDVWQPHLLR